MNDLISRDELLDEVENGINAGLCLPGFERYGNINSMDDIVESIKYADAVPAIPISVIDQIKAEIKNYLEDEKYFDDGISDVGIGLELALNIIDRVVKEYEA